MPNPRINPAVLLSPVEGGYVAYDPAQDRLHQLNPLAALLAELCDGSRSVEDIRGLAGPLLPQDQRGEIDRWIEDGTKEGLIVWEGNQAAKEMSAEDLYTLSHRLKDAGKVQPAYLCAKRIVELKPDYWDGWYSLGDVAQIVGRRDEARDAYQKYLAANPEDGEIEHLLIALSDDAPPPRASDRTIQHIYKNFAGTYETRMLEDLKYAGPQRMLEGITAVAGEQTGLTVLDLGCGSGLAGLAIKPRAARLIGVDLSPEMIELARARNIYDQLEVSEITEWLDKGDTPFDLITCCDCLIYFGDLTPIMAAAARRLKPGGLFAISMELGKNPPYQITDTGRYAHHPDHVREAAARSGLTVERLDESFLRMEYGEEVIGLFAILAKDT
jgi:predicted TPR repeat methyltransferase